MAAAAVAVVPTPAAAAVGQGGLKLLQVGGKEMFVVLLQV
jgi:hypothetical protein